MWNENVKEEEQFKHNVELNVFVALLLVSRKLQANLQIRSENTTYQPNCHFVPTITTDWASLATINLKVTYPI